jgi:hypothetical protein
MTKISLIKLKLEIETVEIKKKKKILLLFQIYWSNFVLLKEKL